MLGLFDWMLLDCITSEVELIDVPDITVDVDTSIDVPDIDLDLDIPDCDDIF